MTQRTAGAIRSAPTATAPVPPLALRKQPALIATLGLFAAVGAIAFAQALRGQAYPRAWQAFLVNLLFWLGVAQGGVVISASLYLTQGRWGGVAAFRLAEAFGGFIPLGFILFWLLYFGRAAIFPWVTHPIAQKAVWLNTPFLFARDGAALAVITILSLSMLYLSRRPAAQRWIESSLNIDPPPPAIRRLAPALAIAYAVVYSLLAFDLVMSLAPMWHSTLFGWYFFAAAFWSAIAAMALTASVMGAWLGRSNRFSDRVMLHDLGKFLFAFSVFWAYLLFAQYIVIWYGDIPVETFFVVLRVNYPPWMALSWAAFCLIWALPFVVLMGRRPKQSPAILGTVAFLGLAGVYLERYVLVVPSLSPKAVPFGWAEALITLGFAGLFGLCSLPGLDLAAAAAVAEARGGKR